MADETQAGPVLIRYRDGREHVVTSAAAAAEHHPDASVVAYEDGRPFVRSRDASLRERAKQTKADKQVAKDGA